MCVCVRACVCVRVNQSTFYFMSVHIEVILDPPPQNKKKTLTHRTMYNQFNNRDYNISIIQIVSYVVTIIEVISIFLRSYPFF